MEAFCNGKRAEQGIMKMGSGKGKVVLSFSVPVTQVQLTPEEAENVWKHLRQEIKNARPLILTPGLLDGMDGFSRGRPQ